MPFLTPDLLGFYVDGRTDASPFVGDLDVLDQLVESDRPFLIACREAAERAVENSDIKSARYKRRWLAERSDAIKEGGVSDEAAFSAWVEGVTERLALKIQKQCFDELCDEYIDEDADEDEDLDDDEDDDDEGHDD